MNTPPVAQNIHDSMTAAATTFPTPPVTMTALATTIDSEVRSPGFSRCRYRMRSGLNVSTSSCLRALSRLKAGLRTPRFSALDTSAPAAPSDLRLRQGELNGSLVARYQASRARSMNQVQTCTADPNIEANWKDAGLFSGGKAPLSGFTPGATVWVRARTVGLKGVMGAWSDPAKIMVV